MNQCMCGREREQVEVDIWTFYKGIRLKVENILAYECAENHIKIPNEERARIKEELKRLYNDMNTSELVN